MCFFSAGTSNLMGTNTNFFSKQFSPKIAQNNAGNIFGSFNIPFEKIYENIC